MAGEDSPVGPDGEVIAKCEEFTLYANGWLESLPEIERALWRATLGISERKGFEDRLDLALCLRELAERAAKPLRVEDAKSRNVAPDPLDAEVGEAAAKRDSELLDKLSRTLGSRLIPMLSDSRPGSAKKKAEMAAIGIRNAITSIQNAAQAIARWKETRPEPGSHHPGAIVWVMQLIAKEIFRETHERPTKRHIATCSKRRDGASTPRMLLLDGKNDSKTRDWRIYRRISSPPWEDVPIANSPPS
jgi:hypothetical protein